MRKKQFIAEFSRKLADLGWSRAQISRTAQEMNDHWDDLEEEGRESGSIPDQFAAERIGTADSLARLQCDCMRSAHWSGRHPILSFALLPPVTLLAWFMAWALMAVGAGELYSKMLGLPHLVWSRFFVVLITAKVIHYSGLFAIPAFF